MSYFTQVKLIIPFTFILYLTVFSFPVTCEFSKINFVQTAESKTSIDSKTFLNFEETTDYNLIEKKNSTNAFPQIVDEDSAGYVQTEIIVDSLSIDSGENTIANPNRVKSNSEETIVNNDDPQNYVLTGKKLIYIFLDANEAQRLESKLIDFGENNIPPYFQTVYLTLVSLFFLYPIMFIFFILILLFLVNIIVVLLILNYTVTTKNKNDRHVKVYGDIYEEALLSYIFGDIDWENTVTKLKNINKPQNRRIVTSVLLNFHENLKGEVNTLIPEIFYNLGLHKDSLKLVKSSSAYKKVQGLRELTYLYPDGAKKIVPEYINYPDDAVRAEAQIAYIRLNENDPFKFLNSLTRPLVRWTQLTAFYMLRLYQLPVLSFSKYLSSKLPTVRNFSLQMITYFQQLENAQEIIDMVNSNEEQTRFLAYKAINDLRLYEGIVPIRNKYRKETTKNKFEIIKALKNIGDEEDFQFLELIIKTESGSLKLEACRSMYFMNQEGSERLIKLSKQFDPEIKEIIAHITDPRN